MKYLSLAIISSLIFLSCKNEKKSTPAAPDQPVVQTDSTLVTDSAWGVISRTDDFDKLKQLFGASNVKDERICGPECVDSVDVTIIYPGTNKEFLVYWEDSFYHKKLGMIRCYTDGAPYHTAGGLKMGTSLKELLKMNGKPIAFLGFGWDYGGGVISLNHGVLESSSLHFILDLSENSVDDKTVYGDTELNSEMPAVKKLEDKIFVREFIYRIN